MLELSRVQLNITQNDFNTFQNLAIVSQHCMPAVLLVVVYHLLVLYHFFAHWLCHHSVILYDDAFTAAFICYIVT